MKYSDIITGGTQETLPWWIVDGVEKEVIWVSKYINVVVNDRAYSLPMKDPKAYIDFDTARCAAERVRAGTLTRTAFCRYQSLVHEEWIYTTGAIQTGIEAMKKRMKRA